jgi:hypothetical protein
LLLLVVAAAVVVKVVVVVVAVVLGRIVMMTGLPDFGCCSREQNLVCTPALVCLCLMQFMG